jgi:hypothetical protein
MAGYPVRLVPGGKLDREQQMPEVVVVRGRRPRRLLEQNSFIRTLQNKLRVAGRSIVVVELDKAALGLIEDAARVVRAFEPSSRVELAYGAENARATMAEVQAKLLGRSGREPTDALAQARESIRATAGLRSAKGRLSAKAVARSFGMSLSQLAAIIDSSRQRVSKTPDSEPLQPRLRPFERIYRLRAALTQAEFASWLQLENGQLDDRSPLDCIRSGMAGVVADMVDDMLTGRPS